MIERIQLNTEYEIEGCNTNASVTFVNYNLNNLFSSLANTCSITKFVQSTLIEKMIE